MIQRKQTLWLLLAGLISAGVLYFDLYRATGAMIEKKVLRVSDHYPSLLISLVMIALPIVAIFMFNNRKRQTRLATVGIVSNAAFLSMMLWRVTLITKQIPAPDGGSYWIGAVLPFVSIVFLILAISGIRKDDKLVRSTDRLR